VIVADLRADAANEAAQRLRANGFTAAPIRVDIGDAASVNAMVEQALALYGRIDILINNAGIASTLPFLEISLEEYERVMRINATSVVVASREVYPYLKQAGGGLIVNIGSFFDKMGVSRSVAYCASKAAIGAITRCMAVEWAADNIRVIDVAPGYIATDLNAEFREKDSVKAWIKRRIPVARPGAPEEVARLVGGLFRSDLGFLTGETIYIDGGQGMFH